MRLGRGSHGKEAGLGTRHRPDASLTTLLTELGLSPSTGEVVEAHRDEAAAPKASWLGEVSPDGQWI